jgi:hypothetical protein
MIIELHRWICDLVEDDEDNIYKSDLQPQGHYESDRIRLDRIDKYTVSDDKTEIILTISGAEFFYDYSEEGHNKIKRYFNLLNTDTN